MKRTPQSPATTFQPPGTSGPGSKSPPDPHGEDGVTLELPPGELERLVRAHRSPKPTFSVTPSVEWEPMHLFDGVSDGAEASATGSSYPSVSGQRQIVALRAPEAPPEPPERTEGMPVSYLIATAFFFFVAIAGFGIWLAFEVISL